MKTHFKLFALPLFATTARILLTLVAVASSSSLASTPNFAVPEDTALRVRLDDTLTSADSEVGDPFSATDEARRAFHALRLRDGSPAYGSRAVFSRPRHSLKAESGLVINGNS